MMVFVSHGYRVIAHDRRGRGRSTQTGGGGDVDTDASDVAALVDTGRVAQAVLISAVPPIMVRSGNKTGRLPIEVFDTNTYFARRRRSDCTDQGFVAAFRKARA